MKQPAIRITNYEDCLMGIGQSYGDAVFVYDKDKIIEKIMNTSKCDREEALGFFNSAININYGPRAPIFFSKIKTQCKNKT